MDKLFGNVEVRAIIKRYALDKYQDMGREPLSLRQVIEIIRRDYPEAVTELTAALLKPLQRDTWDAESRLQAKHDQMVRDGIIFESTLASGIPSASERFRFDNFMPEDNKTLLKARVAVEGWVEGMGSPLLTLVGPTGTGKTHLLLAAVNALAERKDAFLYRTEANLVGELHTGIKDGTVENMIWELKEVPWLVLDDMGATALSPWDEGTRERIIDARWQTAGTWRGASRTLISTNLKRTALPHRIASRIGDTQWGTPLIQIAAVDHRRRK